MENKSVEDKFDTGALRNSDTGSLDFEACLSPKILKRYAEYIRKHRKLTDGSIRPDDNWQKGMPKERYMKSLLRHTMDAWLEHRGESSRDGMEDALCAIIFNAQGMLFEVMRKEPFYDPKIVSCPICQQEFISSNLVFHLRAEHTAKEVEDFYTNLNTRWYTCPQCDFSTTKASMLEAHCEQYHNTIYNYRCPICVNIFVTSKQYEIHYINSHSKEGTTIPAPIPIRT